MPDGITYDEFMGAAFAQAVSGGAAAHEASSGYYGWKPWSFPQTGHEAKPEARTLAPTAAGSSGVLIVDSNATADEDPRWLWPTLKSVDRLQALRQGWDGYGAAPVPRASLNAAIQLLYNVTAFRTPPPDLVPSANGEVQLEWHQGQMDIEVYVGGDSRRAWILDHTSKQEKEFEVSTDLSPLVTALAELTNRSSR